MITRDASSGPPNLSLKRPPTNIEALVKFKLLPLDRTVFRVTELLRNPYVSTKKLAGAIGADPVLAARLLKLANSSLYVRKSPINSIPQAIESIGIGALYDAVMLEAMANGFAKEIETIVSGRAIWEHSVAVALLARELSDFLKMPGTEEAFLCGLLHDIGKILLLRIGRERFEALLEDRSEEQTLLDEEDVFGLTHTEIGAYVTHKWLLSDVVCSVITHHHRPHLATGATILTHLVRVADLIANAGGCGLRRADEAEVFGSESAAFLKLNPAQIIAVREKIRVPLGEVLAIFG
jgi:putative nucleotidyltransferase with HDIG domain